ncbi:MAG: hypothetical protein WDO74_17380 [Pseudomonadota bacterium]
MKRAKFSLGGWFGQGLLGIVALVWLFPYLWMGLTSLKPLGEIIGSPTALWPKQPTWDAYREVFRSLPLARYFFNTSVMAFGIAALQITLALPAGYALASCAFAAGAGHSG